MDVWDADQHYDRDGCVYQWGMVKCQGNLQCRLVDFHVLSVVVYNRRNQQENLVSDALALIIKSGNLESQNCLRLLQREDRHKVHWLLWVKLV